MHRAIQSDIASRKNAFLSKTADMCDIGNGLMTVENIKLEIMTRTD